MSQADVRDPTKALRDIKAMVGRCLSAWRAGDVEGASKALDVLERHVKKARDMLDVPIDPWQPYDGMPVEWMESDEYCVLKLERPGFWRVASSRWDAGPMLAGPLRKMVRPLEVCDVCGRGIHDGVTHGPEICSTRCVRDVMDS